MCIMEFAGEFLKIPFKVTPMALNAIYNFCRKNWKVTKLQLLD